MDEITPEDLQEFDSLCEEAEGMFFVKHQIDLMDYMPEEQHARYRELYRLVHGFCPDSQCGSVNCDNCNGEHVHNFDDDGTVDEIHGEIARCTGNGEECYAIRKKDGTILN